MPIYEYYCSDCRRTFSALRPMAQANATIACATCDGLNTQRMLSLFAVHSSNPARSQASGGGCGCGGGGCGCGAH